MTEEDQLVISSEPKGLRTLMRMVYDDPHHRHARLPPSWKLWVAWLFDQVTTCTYGGGTYCGSPSTAIYKRLVR